MADPEIDLLAIDRGSVTAPAGCGKTHLIAEALQRHEGEKPVLVLTHTNAGVAALRSRMDAAGVPPKRYRLSTLDGWALRLLSTFPMRSEIDPAILDVSRPRNDYPAIQRAAAILVRDQHINDILQASYSRLIVDEYQDCIMNQHAMVYFASQAISTVVLGDPMQAIFGWAGKMPDWNSEVCERFPVAGELTTPWRWINAGTEAFGEWLLQVRRCLRDGVPIDLGAAPPEVKWIHLDGTEDHKRQLSAGMTKPPDKDGKVLIIGNGKNPTSQRQFASQLPGAVTVEAVDLRDLVDFASNLDFSGPDALLKIVNFASKVMTNVGAVDFMRRIEVLQRGTERASATAAELAALEFLAESSPEVAVDLLVEIGKQSGVRAHRPAVLRSCIKALQSCDGTDENTFHDTAIRAREQNRLIGRPLPNRAVGSTLLLKGLEADVSVILDEADLNAKDLYVAMTRGSKRLVICSREKTLIK